MTRLAFAGIDLSIAQSKRVPIVICVADHGLEPLPLRLLAHRAPPYGPGNQAMLSAGAPQRLAQAVRAYLEAVAAAEDVRIACIAIDAPSRYRLDHLDRRAAERALDDARISCLTTPSRSDCDQICAKGQRHLKAGGEVAYLPHANQLWMLAGFALFEELRTLAPCRETFPHAIVSALGVASAPMRSRAGVEARLRAVAPHTGWPAAPGVEALDDIAFGLLHDRVDAYLCSWVASLEEDRLRAFGEPPDDVIWIPRLQRTHEPRWLPSTPPTERQARRRQRTTSSSRGRRKCPACQTKEFAQWPLGWDAHAAWKCTGLTATGPEERKQEFRQRYLG